MKYAKPIAILCLVSLGAGCAHAQAHSMSLSQPPGSICGRWVVKKAIPWAVEPNNKYLGLQVEYLPLTMRFGKEVINNPVYVVDRWSQRDFSEGFHGLYLNVIGIKGNSVVVVKIFRHQKSKEFIGPGTLLFIRNENQIITEWNGIFYVLQRDGPSCVQ